MTRMFLHLVRRESRDVRWHVRGGLLAMAALVCVAQFVLRAIGPGAQVDVLGETVGLWVVAATVLGGGAVAAELFAGDATSRRVEGAALLPVPLSRVFAARLAVVVATSLVFAAWAAAWTPFATWLLGRPEALDGALAALPRAPLFALCALPAVAAVSLFACVLEHGLGAIVAGVAAVGGGLVAVLASAPWGEWGVTPTYGGAAIVLVVVAAFLFAAAGAAFVHGPIHLGRRVRRAAIGVGGAAGVILVCGAATKTALDARADLEPGDRAAVVGGLVTSPDGKTAVLLVGNRRVPEQCRAWLVDLASGKLTTLPGRHRLFEGWTSDGGVRLREGERMGRSGTAGIRYERIDTFDAATGALRSVRSEEQAASEPWTEGWARFAKVPGGYVVEWSERGLRKEFAQTWAVEASPRPGRFLAWTMGGRGARVIDLDSGATREIAGTFQRGEATWLDGGRRLRTHGGFPVTVRVLDCDTGVVEKLEPPAGTWGLFGDGPYASYSPDKRSVAVVDLRDGRTVAGPWGDRIAMFVPGNGRFVVTMALDRERGTISAASPVRLVDLATARETEIRPDRDGHQIAATLVRGLPDGTFLVVRPGCGLDVIDAQGETVRTVLAPTR